MTDSAKKNLLNAALEIRLSGAVNSAHMGAATYAKLGIMRKLDEECPHCRSCPHASVESVNLLERDEIVIRARCLAKGGVCTGVVADLPPVATLPEWFGRLSDADLRTTATTGLGGGSFISNISSSSAHRQGSAFDVSAPKQIPFRAVNKDAPKTVVEEVW